jgi:hypothetical protein
MTSNQIQITSLMSKRKSDWTCSDCSHILKDPILLPCDESICSEHLSERDVKENKIKCNDCNQEFHLKDIQFKSNKTLKKLIESQSYLNKDESKSLKKELKPKQYFFIKKTMKNQFFSFLR